MLDAGWTLSGWCASAVERGYLHAPAVHHRSQAVQRRRRRAGWRDGLATTHEERAVVPERILDIPFDQRSTSELGRDQVTLPLDLRRVLLRGPHRVILELLPAPFLVLLRSR